MTRETTIEVALLLDLGPPAPDGPGLVGLARALALELQAAAEDIAAKADEATRADVVALLSSTGPAQREARQYVV